MVRLARGSIEIQLAEILNNYTEEVIEVLEESAAEVANEAAEELKRSSPQRYGKYAKGWRAKRETNRKGASYIVHNPKHYRLTHLLEKGHAKANGGRTRAQSHIQPAEQKAITEYEKKIRGVLGQ